jgi:folylpolyglutamate synthase/dihydropteroate synthase
MAQWNRERTGKRAAMVLGVVNDKDTSELLRSLPMDCPIYACAPAIPRALDASVWAEQLRAQGCAVTTCRSVAEGINQAKSDGFQAIYVGGSSFVVADALAAYRVGLVSRRRSASND